MNEINSIKDPSVDRFDNDIPVDRMPLNDYLRWAADSDPARGNYIKYRLALPPIQRGFVWKHWQIADLWDSILREMPIGGLTLTKMKAGEFVVPLTLRDRKRNKDSMEGYNLLDGQQRTLALLIGWLDSENEPTHRIWIDLGTEGKNGARFMLRVTTQSQPFGYQAGAREKLLRDDRREARKRYDAENESDKEKHNYQLDLNKTLPWKRHKDEQKYFVPLHKLWITFRKVSGDSEKDKVEAWEKKVRSEGIAGPPELHKEAKERLNALGKAFWALENRTWVALFLVRNFDGQNDDIEDAAHDPLNVLFERISSNGTRLSPEDLLFSMIKQVYPESHDLVHDIHLEVGHLMTASDYVMTALRLACAYPTKVHDDNPNPSAKEFHRYLKDSVLIRAQPSPGPLRRLIDRPKGGGDNPLVFAFKELNNLLTYRKEQNGCRLVERPDTGLPRVLMPYLGRPLLQVLLCWLVPVIDSCPADHELLEESRDDVLRFVLFWLLCNENSKTANKASKIAFEYLRSYHKDNGFGLFPGKDLYEKIAPRNSAFEQIFVPLEIPNILKQPLEKLIPNAKWRSMDERLSEGEDKNLAVLYSRFWWRKEMLLWLQRNWLFDEYKEEEYKPLAGLDEKDDDRVPYDYDHLVPQAHWSDMRSVKIDLNVSSDVKVAFDKYWIRSTLGNSIGNYRIIDSSKNRSRQDDSLAETLGLTMNEDRAEWKKFAFDPSQEVLKLWHKASPMEHEKDNEKNSSDSKRYWGEERLKAFQAAVESRTFTLYCRLFEEAGFSNWFDDIHSPQ